MRTHVLKTTSGCFAVLRRIKSIRRSVYVTVLQSLMVALVLSRLDYGSTLLAGLPKQLLNRLQSVQNAAARLVFAARRNDHITPLLHSTLVTSRWTNYIPACGTYVSVPPWFSARVPDIFVAVGFRRTYSPATSLCFVFWPDGATDNSLHHRWTVFPVSSCIHVECSASFCPFFHINVTVKKSTQDRTIRAFIPAILLNLSLSHCDSTFLFRDLEVFGFTSR